MGPDLHPHNAAINRQDDGVGRTSSRSRNAAAVGVIGAERRVVANRGFPQPLHTTPHAHRAHLHPQENLGQTGGQLVGDHDPEQGQEPAQRATNLARLDPQGLEQRPAGRAAG